MSARHVGRKYIEEEPKELKELAKEHRCVEIQHLVKVFNTPVGPKVAVDDLNVKMYEGQIFCLLGHNGEWWVVGDECRRGQDHVHLDAVGYAARDGRNGEGVRTGHLRGHAEDSQHDGGVSPIRYIVGQFDGSVPIGVVTL